ncbi:transposase [Mesorhizobium sp. M4A.F.Ca.ET.029.04.2.1]|nr:transposase [Mesorhizobium sp. M4A.F.Ca.ET.029.04.2.1]
MTDNQWELIEPFLPRAKATRRPRTTELRAVVDALFYTAWTGPEQGSVNPFNTRRTLASSRKLILRMNSAIWWRHARRSGSTSQLRLIQSA